MDRHSKYDGASHEGVVVLIAGDLARSIRKQFILENLVQAGWDRALAASVIEEVSRRVNAAIERSYKKKMLIGIGMAAVGAVLSLYSYLYAVGAGGGRYVITWGLVAVGLYN